MKSLFRSPGYESQIEQLAKILRQLLVIIGCLGTAIAADYVLGPFAWAVPFDSTDAPDKRSGLSLMIDHKTGCQYLSKGSGLWPRFNRNGVHICLGNPDYPYKKKRP